MEKLEVVISKLLLKKWLEDNPIIKQNEFSSLAGIGNLTTHFFHKNNFRKSTLVLIAKVAIKYGYLNWYSERNFDQKTLGQLSAVTIFISYEEI